MDEAFKAAPKVKLDPDDVMLTRLGSGSAAPFGRAALDDLRAYVDGGQDRTRKAVVGLGALLGGLALVFLVVVLLLGVALQRGLRGSRQALAETQQRLRAAELEKIPLKERLTALEDAQRAIATAVEELRATSVATMRALDGVLVETEKARTRLEAFDKPEAVAEIRAVVDTSIKSVEAELREQLAEMAGRLESLTFQLARAPSDAATGGAAWQRTEADAVSRAQAAAAPRPAPDLMQADLKDPALFTVAELPPYDPGPAPREIRVIQFPNGDHYEGELKDGLMQGWGLYYSSNGDRYDGQFAGGGREGRGTLVFANGDRYVGEFRGDRRTGEGSLITLQGARYGGGFRDGVFEGRGTLLYGDGRAYTGDFKGGLRHGNGILRFANGDVYRGSFVEDRRTGRGVYMFADGAIYTGEFLDGQRHGQGLYRHPNGEEYMGSFQHGQRHGEAISILPGDQAVKGLWEDGRLVRSLPE